MYLFRHTADPVLSLLNAGVDVWIVAALALTVRSRIMGTGDVSRQTPYQAPRDIPSLPQSPGILTSPDQISGYMEALKLSDEGIRQEALRALAHFNDPLVLEALVAALQDQNRSIRIEAIRSLGKITLAESIPPLLVMFKDESRVVREAAVKALAGKGEVVVEYLIRALGDPDWHVRMGATIALRIIGDTRAIDPLIQRLEDENRFVRREVVKSLGRFGDERAQNRLMELREDPDQTVRLRAEVALMKIHGRQFEEDAINIPIDMKEID
jgi:HEAT repeat protein